MTPTLDTECQVGSVTVSRYQSIPDSVRTHQLGRIGEGVLHITLRDISIFTGLPVEGLEAVCLLDIHDPLLPHLEVSSTSQTSFSSPIRKWGNYTRVPSTTKHIEFLWVLFCCFVFFPHSG